MINGCDLDQSRNIVIALYDVSSNVYSISYISCTKIKVKPRSLRAVNILMRKGMGHSC